MSLFNRSPIVPPKPKQEETFKIPQFVKIEGLKTNQKTKYKPTDYISPIFGLAVKDVTVAPHVNKDTGDVAKKFDFIRDNPMEDRQNYREFKSVIIDNEARKEVFGEGAVIDNTRKYVDPRKKETSIEVPYRGKTEKPTFDKVNIPPSNEKPRFEEPKPAYKSPLDELFTKDEPVVDMPVVTPEEKEKPTLMRRFNTGETPKVSYIKPKSETVEAYEPNPLEDQKPIEVTSKPMPTRKPRVVYKFPTPDMFSKVERDQNARPDWLIEQEAKVNETLAQFGVQGKVHRIIKGPTVTRHEIELEPGVNVKAVKNIEDNLMMNLAAKSLRIEAPIPGKPYVGLELPNGQAEIVAFGNVVSDLEFINDKTHPLKIALGVDIDGNNIFADIKKMPHGLIAGATNSGKSVCVNTIIMSLLMKNHPDDLKFILIDPKMVELSIYNEIPHLATPVITDAKMAATALNWACEEMDKRFLRFAQSRTKDLDSYNEKAETDYSLEKMPYIVIIIDELADLMMVSGSEVENSIQRLTQKARAAGIHLLVATQRPTTDVVKGTIKANIPTRIAFRVSSFTDSTTILDGMGAEQLLGRGDMLYKAAERPIRLQGAFLKDAEIEAVTDFIRDQIEPHYLIDHAGLQNFSIKKETIEADDLLLPVAQFVVQEQNASINAIQKQFGIGFNRAQKLVETLEAQGIVSANEGTKARQVLVTERELENMINEN
ncbi:MAG: DNA translocase FtsK [Acholeplasmataceae bacterium]